MASGLTSPSTMVLRDLAKLFLPLTRIDSPEAVSGLLRELGWTVPEEETIHADLANLSGSVLVLRDILYDVEDPGADGVKVAVLFELLAEVENVSAAVAGLVGEIENALTSDFLDQSGIRGAFLPRLFDYLVIHHLRAERPGLHGALATIGLIEETAQDEIAPHQPEFVLRQVHWDRIPLVLSDPGALAELALQWESGFDGDRFMTLLQRMVRSLRLPGGVYLQDPALAVALGRTEEAPQELRIPAHIGGQWPDSYFEGGLSVSVLSPGDPGGVGLALVPYFIGAWSESLSLGSGWIFEFSGSAGTGAEFGLIVRPPIDVDLLSDLVGAGASSPELRFEAALIREATDGERLQLFGTPDSSRMDMERVILSAVFDRSGSEQDIDISVALEQLEMVLLTAEADSFLQSFMPSKGIVNTFDFTLGWSSASGFYFKGMASFDVTVPVYRTIGPITVDTLNLLVALTEGGEIDIELGVTAGSQIGILSTTIERFGLSARYGFPGQGGNMGFMGSSGPSFLPPDGLGLGIDAGVVVGGGYLSFDHAASEYAGVIELETLSVDITAIGILNTKPTETSEGWSFFFSLFLGVPQVPLGFGFTLNGVGGLVGINRLLDVDALEVAIKSGSLDTVLFPADPIADAPIIIAQMKDLFPPAPDRYVFGPVVQIGWGPGTLVEIEIGIVIEVPDPITIAIIGSVSSVLPQPDLDLVVLNMSVGGIIETSTSSVTISAGLGLSSIVQFPLSGDMEFRGGFGDAPNFLFALGGFHPNFDRPDGFPVMERLGLSIDLVDLLEIRFECYLAMTSNTFQFGSAFEFSALVSGFGVNGGAEFDALIYFHPFSVETGVGLYVSIVGAGIDLAAVWLDLDLSGPNPWKVNGQVEFTILGISEQIPVDFKIGDKRAEQDPEAEDVLARMLGELTEPSAWQVSERGAGGIYLVSDTQEQAEVAVSPDGTVGVSQNVVPLGIKIDKGDPWEIVGGYQEFDLEPVASGMASTGEVKDWFAVSTYADLPPNEELTRPSFDELKAGIEFGGGDPTAGTSRTGTLAYEQILRDPELEEQSVILPGFHMDAYPYSDKLSIMAGATSTSGYQIATDANPVSVVESGYAATDRMTGAEQGRAGTWSECRLSAAGRDRATVVAPEWEMAS